MAVRERAICRKNPPAFGSERYRVEVFDIITEQACRTFGSWRYKIMPDGIYTHTSIVKTDWQFFAADFEETTELCG